MKEKNEKLLEQKVLVDKIKELENENMKLKEELEEIKSGLNAKLDFASDFSHDIRTPMYTIMGMSEMALDNIDNKEEVKKNIRIINVASDYMMHLFDDFLTVAKIVNNKIVSHVEKIYIPEQIEIIENTVRTMFLERSQKLIIDISNIEHNHIITDGPNLNRVIINLLNNACKFTAKGGNILLKIVELPCENPEKCHIRIMIKDEGIGISKESLKNVFKPYYRSYTRMEGTGLGLSISKKIVEANNGTISIDSEINKGTTVTIDLAFKIDYSKNESKNTINKWNFKLSNKRILIVEDNKINQMITKKLLEKYGAEVEVADNGCIGFKKFYESDIDEFDLILMDLQMPVMDGYAASKTIRESDHKRAKLIPIIAMTADAFPEDSKRVKLAGMNAHITKPITSEKMVKHICEFLNVN